jgi:hypothetical protein
MADATLNNPTDEPKHILLKDFQEADYSYARFSVTLPLGWTIEDAMRPEFWTNVTHRLARQPQTGEPAKVGTIIELRAVDHSFYAELYVRAVMQHGLTVALTREPVFFGPKAVKDSPFEMRWNVGKRGYDIIGRSDKIIVGDGSQFPTKEAAQAWISSTMDAMKAA